MQAFAALPDLSRLTIPEGRLPALKPLFETTHPDERWDAFSLTLEDLHADLAAITLNESVPAQVRQLFETAKDLCLYSWYVYDFHSIADLTGFLALEAALRVRAEKERPGLAKRRLADLLDHAIASGWITEEGIGHRTDIARKRVEQRKAFEAIASMTETGAESVRIEEPTQAEITEEAASMKVIESICDAARRLRNALAHGRPFLHPDSAGRLRITADLINQLFP